MNDYGSRDLSIRIKTLDELSVAQRRTPNSSPVISKSDAGAASISLTIQQQTLSIFTSVEGEVVWHAASLLVVSQLLSYCFYTFFIIFFCLRFKS